jgi:hypothetical protein
MPDPVLAADIATLQADRVRRLNDLHDDYEQTRKLWKMLRADVQRYGKHVTFHNPMTGTRADAVQLAARTGAVLRRLNEQTFKDVIAQFELFASDLLRIWLTAHVALIEGKALSIKTLFGSTSLQDVRQAALQEAVESTILKRAYGRPADWFRYLGEVLDRPVVSANDVNEFTEMKATRDVLEHAGGVANATYREKSGRNARGTVGAALEVGDAYHTAAFQLIRRIVDAIAKAAIAAA